MKLKPKQWTMQQSPAPSPGRRSKKKIVYIKDNNTKNFIDLTMAEHLRQFSELLNEAGYAYIPFDTLDVKSVFEL
jgi:uncharacterized protein with ATP-grasp and redox domains